MDAASLHSKQPPNIIVVLSDQQRWDTCGCYGQPLPLTPNLDRIAEAGVRFEHAFTCQPVCGPARASLQTGLYPTEIGCHHNNRMLPLGTTTIAHHLADTGYEVGYIGKWHLASSGPAGGPDDFTTKPIPPERRGGYHHFWLASDVLEFTSHAYDGHMFDGDGNKKNFPPRRYRVDTLTDWVIDYLTTRTTTPFFLFISYIEPHHQNDHGHYEGPLGSREQWKDYVVPGDLLDTDGDWRTEYPDYLGCVHSLDMNLARIFDTIDQHELQNTIVIYTSDHGSHFRTRNDEYKRSCHDSCVRIPLVINGPGFPHGVVINELVSLIDIPPTILTAAGIQPPTSMRGLPLQRLFSDSSSGWRDGVFIQISESLCGRALRTHQWKYSVRAPNTNGGALNSMVYEEEFLYDLQQDPYEKNNLVCVPELMEVRRQLAQQLLYHIALAGEPTPEIIPCQPQN